MSNSTTHPAFTETGCYLAWRRGHYIFRDVIDFAVAHGFIMGSGDKYIVSKYDELGGDEDYPTEILYDLCDEAEAWLNLDPADQRGLDRAMKGQNAPPARPRDTYWAFNDGDFGLYDEDELID